MLKIVSSLDRAVFFVFFCLIYIVIIYFGAISAEPECFLLKVGALSLPSISS